MISFGTDFVAGKNRVPKPATGNIAFVTVFGIGYSIAFLLARANRSNQPRICHVVLSRVDASRNPKRRPDVYLFWTGVILSNKANFLEPSDLVSYPRLEAKNAKQSVITFTFLK